MKDYKALKEYIRHCESLEVPVFFAKEGTIVSFCKMSEYTSGQITDDLNSLLKEWSEPKWIDVNERLPRRMDDGVRSSVDVLVAKDDGSVSISYYEYGVNKWRCDIAHRNMVTHWMPLPESPVSVINDKL